MGPRFRGDDGVWKLRNRPYACEEQGHDIGEEERWGGSVARPTPSRWNPFCCPVGPTAL
jgi:hypothetical protein